MRCIGVTFRAAAAITVVAMASVLSVPAWADDNSLDVVGVDGRQVQLVMTLAPTTQLAANASVIGSLEVAGTVLPAVTRLEVANDTRPKTAILVLDASGSMKGDGIDAARAAASTFVNALPSDVKVGLVAFSDQSRVLAKPAADKASVIAAIDSVRADGATALFDAVRMGLGLVPAGEQARLVVLSDGKDTVSQTSLSEVTRAASTSGVPIDVVAMRQGTDNLQVLKAISGRSGGALLAANTVSELPAAFTAAKQSFSGSRIYLTSTIPTGIDASGQPVTATVKADGSLLQQTTTLPATTSLAGSSLPATVSAPPAAATNVSPPLTRAGWVVPILLGVAVAATLLLIVAMFVRARRIRGEGERVNQVMAYQSGNAQGADAPVDGDPRALLAPLDRYLAKRSHYRETQIALAAAEVQMTPAEWLASRIAAMLVLALVLSLLLRSPWLGVLVGLIAAWFMTATWLRSRVAARREAFAEQLPDFMMLLSSSLRAGMSFTHALESTSAEGQGEVGRQMQRALREVQIGSTTEVALMECADRMDNDDLRWTVTALSIQREVGGSLSAILDTSVNTIKGRAELRREVRTLSAEGRMSAYILVALPVSVAAFLFFFRREYVSLLWTTTLGLAMLMLMVVLIFFGWIWMRGVVRIKV